MSKLIIFSAPSGAGKTTIVKHILNKRDDLEFSISATSRKIRTGEVEGKDYYFLDAKDFRTKIENNEFVEYEEVYKDNFYGTLKSEVERIWNSGNSVLFDVDVNGGLSIKNVYKENALLIFVEPPSVEELERRLRSRSTETEKSINERVSRAKYELSLKDKFDVVLVNDKLDEALIKAEEIIENFLCKG